MPPTWARFYEIGTNKPIFCDRDGVAKHKLDEIGYERRNGYSWLNYWPQRLLERDYPAWQRKVRLRNRLRQADFQAKDDQGDDCPGRRLDGGRRFRMGKIIGQIMAEELEKLVPDLAPYIK